MPVRGHATGQERDDLQARVDELEDEQRKFADLVATALFEFGVRDDGTSDLVPLLVEARAIRDRHANSQQQPSGR